MGGAKCKGVGVGGLGGWGGGGVEEVSGSRGKNKQGNTQANTGKSNFLFHRKYMSVGTSGTHFNDTLQEMETGGSLHFYPLPLSLPPPPHPPPTTNPDLWMITVSILDGGRRIGLTNVAPVRLGLS